MASKQGKLGWHFLPSNLTLTNGDGRKVRVGAALKMQGSYTPQTCHHGMHASVLPCQAASFERGPVLSRVQVWGDIDEDSDKFAGRYRRVLWMKEIDDGGLRWIAKSMGESTALPSNVGNVSYWLKFLAGVNDDEFDKAVELWARKNGAVDKVGAIPFEKPRLEEKDLLKVLAPRLVRTKKEVLRDLGSVFDMAPDDDGCYDDRFEELVDECHRIRAVEDIDGKGTNGYVLQSRSR